MVKKRGRLPKEREVKTVESRPKKQGQYSKEESREVVGAATSAARRLGLGSAAALFQKETNGRTKYGSIWGELSVTFNRTPVSLYSHVKRQVHPGAFQGPWTEAETTQLKALFDVLGTDWTTIAAEMHRTPENCRDRYRRRFGEPQFGKASINHGKWTDDEFNRLTSAKVHGKRILDADDRDVDYLKLTKRVKSRSLHQVRRKYLTLREQQCDDPESMNLLRFPAHQLELCENILDRNYLNDDDIVWRDVVSPATASSPSHRHNADMCWRKLRKRFPRDPFPVALDSIISYLRAIVDDAILKQWEQEDQ